MYEEKNIVQSVEKSIRLISELNKQPRQTPAGLSKILGISRTATYRLLWTLEKHKVVVVNQNSEYSLGPFFFSTGLRHQLETGLIDISLPSMMRLRNETSETVGIYFAQSAEIVCGEILESPYELRRVTRPGDSLPMTSGAVGKCYLAWRIAELHNQIEFLSSAGVEKDDMDKWLKLLAEIRNTGYSVSWEERVPGGAAISAPILDRQGKLRAAISISGPIGRITPKSVDSMAQMLCNAAHEIEQLLNEPSE
jgi:IclR family KDG regulon transcriptional repressor